MSQPRVLNAEKAEITWQRVSRGAQNIATCISERKSSTTLDTKEGDSKCAPSLIQRLKIQKKLMYGTCLAATKLRGGKQRIGSPEIVFSSICT